MDKVTIQIDVPKESKEVIDAACAIVEHFKAGKGIAEAAALLPAVMVAVDGVNKIGDEAKSHLNDELAGYTVHRVFSALKGPEAQPL